MKILKYKKLKKTVNFKNIYGYSLNYTLFKNKFYMTIDEEKRKKCNYDILYNMMEREK